jgi:hypothetical protein
MFPGSYFAPTYWAAGFWSGTGEAEIVAAIAVYFHYRNRRSRR